MKPFLLLYATREGQTRRIAEHVAATLRARGFDVDVHNIAELTTPLKLDHYAGAWRTPSSKFFHRRNAPGNGYTTKASIGAPTRQRTFVVF